MRIDLGVMGIVYAHPGWNRLRGTDRVWVHNYANGWERRVRVRSDGRVLYARWIRPTT
ncbi:hypothetical protein P1P75_01220 [Streptomyces sp. ID05-39B]|uniref:hypothetical protein n=1 Tax=Streptomyces sp. ID05-39B TaxID=3028664 RepID=UPI0029A5BF7E|nr:hypothetical protein [Streptomyces sp. ID05-39B]MDX3525103.1 hypothetical protein [Streptomyces sp. ID05-39B]